MASTEKSPPPLEMTPAPCYLQRVTGTAPSHTEGKMTIIRSGNKPQKARFSVGLNIILTGSKKMSPQEQEELLQISSVRVLIVDSENPATVLVDEIAPAKEFSTGSVGYGLNLRDSTFLTA
jgi:hypothetical protein